MKKYLLAGVMTLALTIALVGSSVNAQTFTFTRNLTIGSTGTDVATLQTWLVSRGFAIPAINSGVAAPGYFGTQTRAAVMAYQAANGIPSTGFFGPLTMASINSKIAGGTSGGVICPSGFTCTPTTPPVNCPAGFICTPIGGGTPTTGTPDLSGNFGTISDVNILSQFSNEEVGEGEEEVKVLGFEVEASNEGDIALRTIRVSFDPSGTSGSDHLDDYIDRVSVWQGDEEIGNADVDEFDENNNDVYTAVITLDNDAIVRADQTEDFYITVDSASNLDSQDISGDSWEVDVEYIRYEDAEGVVTTDSDTGDIGQMDAPIDFVSFSSASDTELHVSLESDSPDEGIIIIDADSGEDDVLLLRGSIEIEGDSDVNIDEIPVTLTVSGGVTDVDALINTLTLEIDGNTYSENVSSSGSSVVVTFNDLDLDIEAGDTVEFSILGDINEFSGDFAEGGILTASITADNVDDIDVENEQGDQLNTSSERSGTAIGEELEFRETGISPRLISSGTSIISNQSSNDDTGSFRIRFSLTAVGDTVYVSSLAGASGFAFAVDKAGTNVSSGISATLTNVNDNDLTANGNYMIEEGETETFEMVIVAQLPTAGTAGLYRGSLTSIKWDTEDDPTPDNTYSTNLESFRTSYTVLN